MSSVSALNSALGSTTNNTNINISSVLAAAAGTTTPAIDVNAAVAAALYADRAPERIWQSEQTTFSSQTSALTSMQTAATTLTTDMNSMNSITGPLSARAVSSSNSADVTATAASGTVPGNHTVAITSLASTASWYSDTAQSATAALPAESFTISTTAGPTASFTVGSGVNTLNDLVATINTSSLGLTASVVTDASGSRLALVSNGSGSANDFSVTSAPTTTTSWSSPAVASSGATLAANTFTLTNAGVTTTVNITDGETLGQIASGINSSNLGVNASVAHDSSGYHLQVVSGDGTTPFTISMPSFGFSQAAAGANAALTVDGIPITSATNTVTGAVPGVTLHLFNPTGSGKVNLSVASDTAAVSASINGFVSDYNTAIGLVNAQYSYNTTTGSEGSLAGDATVRSLQSTLLAALSYSNPNATSSVSTLSSLGITVNNDGTLAVDNTTLNSALTTNPTDVQQFFQGGSLNGFANSVSLQLNELTAPATGAFSVDLTSISKTSQDLTTQINNFESIYLAQQKTTLTAMYSKAEIALQQLPSEMAQIQAELGNNAK
ncbi:MAG TPA: flagellar filament capping protein FliD [Acidisarcina sp.]